jgi:hypothetical protein
MALFVAPPQTQTSSGVDETMAMVAWEFDAAIERITAEGGDRLLIAGCRTDEVAALCDEFATGFAARRPQLLADVRARLRGQGSFVDDSAMMFSSTTSSSSASRTMSSASVIGTSARAHTHGKVTTACAASMMSGDERFAALRHFTGRLLEFLPHFLAPLDGEFA